MESLEEIRKQIESLIKKEEELEDTLAKEELSKNRFRYVDYGNNTYYVKILSVNESDCDCILICLIDNNWQLRRQTESILWLWHTEVITEDEYNNKFNDVNQLFTS